MARRRFNSSPYDTINLTPLIDTLFFLLIIFMITAPLLEYTIEVDPPEMNADPLPKDAADNQNLKTINLTKDGHVIFDENTITQDECIMKLMPYRTNPDFKIFLRADRELSYGKVIAFLAKMHGNGFKNVSLVTTEEEQ
ncbi:MAG: biopolymer transporter ExbD [Lentisphaeria bacterium]|nr:biopolymer transporter ExbD [Lentisphaeria bacterium]